MPQLICITGRDGTGKSTLVRGLAQALPGTRVSHIWELLRSPKASLPFQSKGQVDDFLCALTPDSRLLFLAHAMKYSLDEALSSGAERILINSYHYKYFASELALGADLALVQGLEVGFPAPDLVIQLTVPIAIAVERKEQLSRYECGLVAKPDAAAFTRFQEQIQPQWAHFVQPSWHQLDATQSPEALVAQSVRLIQALS